MTLALAKFAVLLSIFITIVITYRARQTFTRVGGFIILALLGATLVFLNF